MYKYIIQGAGAIGSAIGGTLAKAGFDVTLVARRPHVEAIKRQKGLYLHTLSGTVLQPIRAVESISDIEVSENSIIFQTMKANDTASSLNDLKSVTPKIPIVCCQNGIDNESIVSTEFNRVYGGVVRFTATMMTLGETNFAGIGKLIFGRYPEGIDDITEGVAEDLSHTGFTVLKSNKIMQDKWLKLLVNLISCVKPMTLKTPQEPNIRIKICRNAFEEGINVLNKAGIKALSTNGTEDSPEEMLKNFDNTLRLAEGEGQGMKLLNSTWQSLAKHNKILENDWYTGTVIKLGKKFNVPTPYNESILFHLYWIAERDIGPETVDVENIINKAEELSKN